MQGHRVIVAVCALAALGAAAAPAGATGIQVVSNRADLISGGDALVRVTGVSPGAFTADVDGRDVTSAFGDGTEGLVTGLRDGVNRLTVRAPGAPAERIDITNHPIGGPVFSGDQIQPWLCTTADQGLGPATDKQCNAPTKVEFFYKSTDQTKSGFQPYDPKNPPSDVAETTTDQGKTVPYVVRRESGTANRGIYQIALLDKAGAWNHKLYYLFGASCGTVHSQSSPTSVLNDLALSRGFMTADSSMNVLGNNCSTETSGESAVMLKEHILESYGSIRYTMANGCSGGSIGQHVVANEFPGLLDGIQPACTYADNWTTGIEVNDCHLLLNYFNTISPQLWAVERQRAAVDGHRDNSDCVAWDVTFSAVSDPTDGCGLPAEQMYDPATNPKGCRGTLQDFMINVMGKRPPSLWTAPEKKAGGFAKSAYDNIGVQYGLNALNSGLITADQFVDMNSKIGGVDIDFNNVPERSKANPGALHTLYSSGQIDDTRNLDKVADIELQDWSETAEIHTSFHAWSTRARMDKANGNHDNQIIWTYPASAPILGVGPSGAVAQQSFLLLDQWLSRVEADHGSGTREQKIARDKPGDAVDGCFVADHQITDMNTCQMLYPHYADARIEAGGPFTDDIGKCRLKPLDRADYAVTFSDDQWTALKKAFPSGVCDWSRPGVDQVPARKRPPPGGVCAGGGRGVARAPPTRGTTSPAGPGGRPMPPAPVSQPLG